jgi:hypothetical protein
MQQRKGPPGACEDCHGEVAEMMQLFSSRVFDDGGWSAEKERTLPEIDLVGRHITAIFLSLKTYRPVTRNFSLHFFSIEGFEVA